MMTMTKTEFIEKLREGADKFDAYIDECNKKYPEAKCEDLSSSEWFEQFVMWAEQNGL